MKQRGGRVNESETDPRDAAIPSPPAAIPHDAIDRTTVAFKVVAIVDFVVASTLFHAVLRWRAELDSNQ